MASKKQVEVGLSIKALNKLSRPLNEMERDLGSFGRKARKDLGELSNMRGPVKMIEDLRKTEKQVGALNSSLDKNRNRLSKLNKEKAATGRVTKKTEREIAALEKAVRKEANAHKEATVALNGKREAAQKMGIAIDRLGEEEKRYAAQVEAVTARTNASWEKRKRKQENRDRFNRRMGHAGKTALAGTGVTYVGGRMASFVTNPVKRSISEEAAFMQVNKVANIGDKDGEAAKLHRKKTLRKTRELPVSVEELFDIQAIAANAGIQKENLIGVSANIAKVKTAFDMDAYASGEAFAKIKSGMSLSVDETFKTFDAINHLSNKYSADARDIVEFTKQSAGLQASSGFSREDWLGLGTSMIAGGAAPEVAKTSAKNFSKTLSKGSEKGDTRRMRAFAALGIDPDKVAKEMQVNPKDTALYIIEALQKVAPEKQQSMTLDMFGDEATGIYGLVANPDRLKQVWKDANDTGAHKDSVANEAETMSSSRQNQIQLFMNRLDELKIKFGGTLFPVLDTFLGWTNKLIDKINNWADANEGLAAIIGQTAAAVVAAVSLIGGALLSLAAFRGMAAIAGYGGGLLGGASKRGGFFGFGSKGGSKAGAGGRVPAAGSGVVGSGRGGALSRVMGAAGRFLPLGFLVSDLAEKTAVKEGETEKQAAVRNFQEAQERFRSANEAIENSALGRLGIKAGLFTPQAEIDQGKRDDLKAEIADDNDYAGKLRSDIAETDALIQSVKGTAMEGLRLPVLEAERSRLSEELAAMTEAIARNVARLNAMSVGSSGAAGSGLAVDGKRALGGGVRAGGLYEVGERGRELFSPNLNGEIISNDTMQTVAAAAQSVQAGAISAAGRSGGGVTFSPTLHVSVDASGSTDPVGVGEAAKDQVAGVLWDLLEEAQLESYANSEAA